MRLAVLVPAAGASRRMRGRDKLIERLGAETILARTVGLALQFGDQVIVTLPSGGPFAPARRAALAGLAATLVPLAGADEGMAASLRLGAGLDCDGLMVLLPDMPAIGLPEVRALCAAFAAQPQLPCRGASGDLPGHPVLLPRRLLPRLAFLRGAEGARSVLQGEAVTLVPLPGKAAVLDLDTPEAWAAYRQGLAGGALGG